jgi:hypothetical protein
MFEIDIGEVENYKNQLLNLVKEKLKEEENRNSNPNSHHNFYHTTGSEVPPNSN